RTPSFAFHIRRLVMRRYLAASLMFVAAIVVSGCNEQPGSNPSGPTAAPQFANDGDPIVLPQIWMLFPDDSRGIAKGARDRYWDIVRSLNVGDIPTAQKKVFNLVTYT